MTSAGPAFVPCSPAHGPSLLRSLCPPSLPWFTLLPSQGRKLCSPALQGLSSSRKTGPSQLAVTSMLQRFSLGSAMGSPDMREVVVEPRVPLQRVGFPCGQGRQVSPPCVIFPCPWRGRAPGMDDPAVTQGPDVSPRGSRIWGRVAPDADAVRSTRSPPGFI